MEQCLCTNQILNYLLRLSYGWACLHQHDWHADEQLRKLSMCDPQDDRFHEILCHWAVGWFSGVLQVQVKRVRHLFPGSSIGVRRYHPSALMRSPVDLRAAGSSGSPVPCWGSASAAVGAPLRLMRKHL